MNRVEIADITTKIVLAIEKDTNMIEMFVSSAFRFTIIRYDQSQYGEARARAAVKAC